MTSEQDAIRDSVARMLRDTVTPEKVMAREAEGLDVEVWNLMDTLGLRGDTGLDLAGHAAVLQELARAAALVPYAESEVLGRWLADLAGLTRGSQTLTVLVAPPQALRTEQGLTLNLSGQRLHWGRHAQQVLVVVPADGDRTDDVLVDIPIGKLQLAHESNLAGEPVDQIISDTIAAESDQVRKLPAGTATALQARGALCRVAAMTGALERHADMAHLYSRERRQFGKSLSQFQLIQSYIAQLAEEVCAANMSLDVAVAALGDGAGMDDIAVAKIRTGQAARLVTSLSHQIHGAMGVTLEYPLHLWSRRLWSWREEYGNETHWSALLGRGVIASGDGFWAKVSSDPLLLEAS